MRREIQQYVGQIVRLNAPLFRRIREQAARHGIILDNAFVVAQVSRKMKRLICYGSSFRIVVDVADVAFA